MRLALKPSREVYDTNSLLIVTAAAVVGTTAAAAYTDAKFHVTKDLVAIRRVQKADKALAQAGMVS